MLFSFLLPHEVVLKKISELELQRTFNTTLSHLYIIIIIIRDHHSH